MTPSTRALLPKGGTSPAFIAPSILSARFEKLAEEIKDVERAGVEWIHVDVMDGHFVPNLTIGPPIVKALRPLTELVLDCHLMVSQPEKWIEPFAKAGADIITIHVEASSDLSGDIDRIHALGCKAGVSLNPATSLNQIERVLPKADVVLVMSVNPGFGGQSFIESSIDKVKQLAQMRGNSSFLIEVDGGVSASNTRVLRSAGCDVFVAGSAIFGASDRKKAIQEIRKEAAS